MILTNQCFDQWNDFHSLNNLMLVQTLILAAGVFAATNYKSSTAYKCLATGVSPFYTLKESLTETNVNFLKENEIKSAFFIDETWIQSKKNVLDLIKNEGHEIGLYRSGDKWGGN